MSIPARLIRNLHASKPLLTYAISAVLWLLTTTILLYFIRFLVLNGGGSGGLTLLVTGLATLAIHSALSVYLGDGLKIRLRRQKRENVFISFLGRLL